MGTNSNEMSIPVHYDDREAFYIADNTNYPILNVSGVNLPGVWESAVEALWEHGARIATQYDAEGDPLSRDAIAHLTVYEPLSEPRIHRGMPGGITELVTYVEEVVRGIHNSWIDINDPQKWFYTYNQRFCEYPMPDGSKVNQVDYVLKSLADSPHTRRAQMITWQPWFDTTYDHAPCLQRAWFRVFQDKLLMNVHIRSNDAFKASFMNAYAFIELQKWMADKLSERIGREISVGQYTHIADSFHIYGSYFEEFERFLELSSKRSWEGRTYRSDDPAVLAEMEMAYAAMNAQQ